MLNANQDIYYSSFFFYRFAFIDLKEDHRKALLLDGSYMRGRKLEVTIAFDREEFNPYELFMGVQIVGVMCSNALTRTLMDMSVVEFGIFDLGEILYLFF